MTHAELKALLANDDFDSVAYDVLRTNTKFSNAAEVLDTLRRLEQADAQGAHVPDDQRAALNETLAQMESAWQAELKRRERWENVTKPMAVAGLLLGRTARLRVFGGWLVVNETPSGESMVFVTDMMGHWTLPTPPPSPND